MPSTVRLGAAVGQFLEGYFATRDRSEKTYKAYACDLEQFGKFQGADTPLTALGPDEIEAWAAELKRREYAPASIQRKMVSLRVFCHYWMRKGAIEDNPFWRVRLSFGRATQLPRTLTEGEIRRLLDQARTNWRVAPEDGRANGSVTPRYLALRNYAFLDLLFATGIRVGEAAALNLGSFDEEEAAYRVRGKGRRPRLAFLVDPKSLELQALHRAARRAIPTDTDALFLNIHHTPLSTQGMANILKKLRREAHLTKRVTPHMIRHTIATLLLRNGVDLRVVQEFLGHASITSTQRYTHITKNHLIAALRQGHPGLR